MEHASAPGWDKERSPRVGQAPTLQHLRPLWHGEGDGYLETGLLSRFPTCRGLWFMETGLSEDTVGWAISPHRSWGAPGLLWSVAGPRRSRQVLGAEVLGKALTVPRDCSGNKYLIVYA